MSVMVVSESGDILAQTVERAETLWRRLVGLIGRRELPAGHCLLLEPCAGIHTFFMRFPIDACYLSGDGTILRCIHSLKPWRLGPVIPGTRRVLELPAGTLRRAGIREGQRLYWSRKMLPII